MSIHEYLTENFNDLSLVVNDLSKNTGGFSSHDIIEKFTKLHEYAYIGWLDDYKKQNKKAFQSVHSQIARFVSEHCGELGIKKASRKGSEHVFGDVDIIQWWEKN